jgi:hypothetical protein
VLRAANRMGYPVADYLRMQEEKKKRATNHRSRALPSEVWTLPKILARLDTIYTYLNGKVPSYIQLYRSVDLRTRFNSCGLAGAIFKFNKKNGIRTYADFLWQHKGWQTSTRFTKPALLVHLKKVVQTAGGVPRQVAKTKEFFGVNGRAFDAAFSRFMGMTVSEYCNREGIKRLASRKVSRRAHSETRLSSPAMPGPPTCQTSKF